MIRPTFAVLARLHRNLLGRRLARWAGRQVDRRPGSERVWLAWRSRTARGVRHGHALWPGRGLSIANDNAGVLQR
jgi:hypothetical protein